MSVRAYRVEKIVYSKSESFNLWHDSELADFLDDNDGIRNQLNEDGCGIFDIAVETLEKALEKLNLPEYVRESLEKDIKEAKEKGDDYITYYAF